MAHLGKVLILLLPVLLTNGASIHGQKALVDEDNEAELKPFHESVSENMGENYENYDQDAPVFNLEDEGEEEYMNEEKHEDEVEHASKQDKEEDKYEENPTEDPLSIGRIVFTDKQGRKFVRERHGMFTYKVYLGPNGERLRMEIEERPRTRGPPVPMPQVSAPQRYTPRRTTSRHYRTPLSSLNSHQQHGSRSHHRHGKESNKNKKRGSHESRSHHRNDKQGNKNRKKGSNASSSKHHKHSKKGKGKSTNAQPAGKPQPSKDVNNNFLTVPVPSHSHSRRNKNESNKNKKKKGGKMNQIKAELQANKKGKIKNN